MARGKDVKKGRHQKQEHKNSEHPRVIYAGFWSRFLAFVTDVFMIGIPIVLVIMMSFGYETLKNQPGFMDGVNDALAQKEAKAHHNVAINSDTTSQEKESNPVVKPNRPDMKIFLITLSLWTVVILAFWYKTGQTPGKKMARVILVDAHTFKRPSFLQLVMRFIFLIMPLFAFISIPLMLFTKKRLTLHDLISRTTVIYKLD